LLHSLTHLSSTAIISFALPLGLSCGRSHIYINVSTGSKVTSIAGTLAYMIRKGTPRDIHTKYDDKKDPEVVDSPYRILLVDTFFAIHARD